MKHVHSIHKGGEAHWVGDGFRVRTIFSDEGLGERISPFLLLDYAGPAEFPPSKRPRGVGEHPHRGFETVTIVYQGTIAHRDSAGNAGIIGPGDVQWMTAASGVVHEEKHEKAFARQGGTLEAVQLWVNLPKSVKMGPPRYQTLLNKEIPVVYLADGAGSVRVIAGEFRGVRGPARTFTPVHLYDLHLMAGHQAQLTLPIGYNSALFVRRGDIVLNRSQSAHGGELALFDSAGELILLDAKDDAMILVLSGEPIPEPVASYGPFVMNTQEELAQAMEDYRMGKMGHLG